MSHDVIIGDNSLNVTYNYQPAFAACGMSSLGNISGLPAAKAKVVLAQVLVEAWQHPEVGNLIRGGGTWGTYRQMLETLEQLIEFCHQNPLEQVTVV